MRIVVTNNGTKFIEDLSPNNSIDYNSDTIQNNLSIIKLRLKNLKKNKSVNQMMNMRKNNKFYFKSLSNLNSNLEKIDVGDVLNSIKTNNDNINQNNKGKSFSPNINNLKIIKLKNKKKIKLPKILESRYILFDSKNKKKENEKVIPEILLSINDSIDNDNYNKRNLTKNAKTISQINTINFSDIEDNNNFYHNDDIFPKIRKSFPLKYIIDKDSYKRLNKEMKNLENDCNIEKKLFPKNYFIKNNWENSKKRFDLSLKNEINSKNINLIEYLNKDKNISNIFIQKFCNLNKEEINKLDAISKKLLYKKKQDIQFNENIKNKIKANIMNININFRQSLNNMNNKLNKYELILNKGKDKNILNDKNDKNRYLEQFMDAEKNWDKYNLERLYKKSSSPRRSLFRPLQE